MTEFRQMIDERAKSLPAETTELVDLVPHLDFWWGVLQNTSDEPNWWYAASVWGDWRHKGRIEPRTDRPFPEIPCTAGDLIGKWSHLVDGAYSFRSPSRYVIWEGAFPTSGGRTVKIQRLEDAGDMRLRVPTQYVTWEKKVILVPNDIEDIYRNWKDAWEWEVSYGDV